MGQRRYRSRRSTRALDPYDNRDAVGSGLGPTVIAIKWQPDPLELFVTFSAAVQITKGMIGRVLFTDSNGVNYKSTGEITGDSSDEVHIKMAFDPTNTNPRPGFAFSNGLGVDVRALTGEPVQDFYRESVIEDVAEDGPQVLAAFFVDGPDPVLTLIFNMTVTCDDAASTTFVYSALNGGTLQPNTLPTGSAGGSPMLTWNSFEQAGSTPAGTVSITGATSSIIGEDNTIEMANLVAYPFTPTAPQGAPGPHVISASWDSDNLKLQLTFDQDIVPVASVAGLVTFRDANGVGWVADSIDEAADEVLNLNMAWANSSAAVGTTSSAALGTAIHSQVTGVPAVDFTALDVTPAADLEAPYIVHAKYIASNNSLQLFFNQEVADDGTTAGKIAFHFPAALGGDTLQSAAEVTIAGGMVTVTNVAAASVIVADEGTTSCNLAGNDLKGVSNDLAVTVWTSYPVEIIE